MRDLGSPAHDRRWFEQVFAQLGPRAGCYLVERQNKTIAGLVAIEFRNTVVVPWASSDRAYRHLCPNNLLYWTALRDAAAQGFEQFDFGRSSVGSGTYRFKQQWGSRETQLYWQEVDPMVPDSERRMLALGEVPPRAADEPELDRTRAWAARLWQRLPVPVATWLGGRLRGGITL
jgi:hypothetical protein